MTDTSHPLATFTSHDFSLPPVVPDIYRQPQHAAPPTDGAPLEDDGQISCVCGYADDDGWTVQCEQCNRWQHQSCYYPDYEDRSLPEEQQHLCIECDPRPFDIADARARQRGKREAHDSLTNGLKRPGSKSHKKKVKEPTFTNGWPLDKSRHDRNSASPRDQPPPSKRPKTSHRPSNSVASTKGHSRKRNMSSATHRRTLSRSPETPTEYYSDEFLHAYAHDDWTHTNVNLFNSIGVTNALSAWLSAPEDEFRERHGHEKTEVLMRWDGDLDDIPGKAQLELQDVQDDNYSEDTSDCASWKMITVKESVAKGAYLGELKGHVGFKEDYQEDEANRWPLLRHPEPFVFFHPRLPIYIDARNEGTLLRYVRRTCMPNAKLQVLVTDQTEYRFCFMAMEQIDPGMEIAVAWDTSDGLPELLNRGISARDMDRLSSWVSTVLANCGPCACIEGECYMSRFDRRLRARGEEGEEAPADKVPKSKKKKAAAHILPLDTTNINSRSGSEVRKGEMDDEPMDSRSASGSASRDITPHTHYSHNGSAIPEVSERERKKLAKEEEMFKRQEESQTGKQGKKKRHSGGSNLSTPNATSSKQLGFSTSLKYANAGTDKQSGLPTAKSGRRGKGSVTPKMPVRTITKIIPRPKPEYVDAEVQCDLDQEDEDRRQQQSPPRRPPLMTLTTRLRQRCAVNNARKRGPEAVAEAERSIREGRKIEVEEMAGAKRKSPPQDAPGLTLPSLGPDRVKSFAMQFSERNSSTSPTTQADPQSAPGQSESQHHLPQLAGEQLAPPWPSQASHTAADALGNTATTSKPPDMHLQMPPPPSNPFAGGPLSGLSSGTPNSLTGPIIQSPLSVTGAPPIFSPSVNAAVGPSPARKKLSLSDYTKRKAKDKDGEPKGDRESSPASTASGPVASSLLSASELSKVTEEAVVDEDVKMEDVSPIMPPATT